MIVQEPFAGIVAPCKRAISVSPSMATSVPVQVVEALAGVVSVKSVGRESTKSDCKVASKSLVLVSVMVRVELLPKSTWVGEKAFVGSGVTTFSAFESVAQAAAVGSATVHPPFVLFAVLLSITPAGNVTLTVLSMVEG